MAAAGGPLVRRSVRRGATLWVLGVAEFVIGMIVAQLAWTHPKYSLTQNVISDLGAIHCGSLGTREVCSPLHLVFNVSLVIAGLLLLAGLALVRTSLPEARATQIGVGLLVAAGIGAIGVGSLPEDYFLPGHLLSALLAFAGGNVALLCLGLSMRADARWGRWSLYSMVSGIVGLVALGLLVARAYEWGGFFSAWGEGGIERTVAAPIFLWLLATGIYLLRLPTYAPAGLPKPGAPG
jgi:hypothetical membrane protein